MSVLLFGLIGMLLGSFLALATERYSLANNYREWLRYLLSPASHCAHCLHQLRWRELIPGISWLLLRGKCRYCSQPLPFTLLLLEYISSLLLVVQYWLIAGLEMQLWMGGYTLMLLLLADIDRRYGVLPDILTLPFLWAGLIFHSLHNQLTAVDAIAGAAAGYLAFAFLAEGWQIVRGSSGMGYGDVKLFAALGAWHGWASLPEIALLAAGLGIAGTLAISFFHKAKRNVRFSRQPFGPYLAVAGWIIMFIKF